MLKNWLWKKSFIWCQKTVLLNGHKCCLYKQKHSEGILSPENIAKLQMCLVSSDQESHGTCWCSVRFASATLWTTACQAPLSLRFSGKNTRVGSHFLLQGTLLTQRSSLCLLCLLCCRQIVYPVSHWGKESMQSLTCTHVWL